MSFRDAALAAVNVGRKLVADLGLRQYAITMRTVAWTGQRPGLGTSTTTDTPLTIDGIRHFKCVRLTGKDIIPGGVYREGDFRIGPITPPYPGGGVSVSAFDPSPPLSGSREILYQITGPGFDSGVWCRKVDVQADANLHYYFTLRLSDFSAT